MDRKIGRRDVVRGGLWLSLVSISASKAVAQDDPATARPKPGDLLVRDDDPDKKPLTPSDLVDNAKPAVAWAMEPATKTIRNGSRFNRLAVGRLGDEVFAYTMICTHDGCDVTDWLADEHMLSCPCHYSKFDPRDAGRVKDGPAPRALPQLPLKVVDGRLAVAAPFTSRVGFESQ
jgi:rieske iron-sulfur protein